MGCTIPRRQSSVSPALRQPFPLRQKGKQAQTEVETPRISPMKTDFLTRRSIPLAVLTGLLVSGSGLQESLVHNPAPPRQAQQAAQPTLPPRRPADRQRHSGQDQGGVGVERPEHPGEHGQRSSYAERQGRQRCLPRAGGGGQRFGRRGEDGGQQPGGGAIACGKAGTGETGTAA